jgi:tagatose 6-phosphate kinase
MITTVTMNTSVDRRYSLEALEPGTVMRVSSARATAGGKGLNVARVLRILGAEVLATGLAGGRNGEFVESELSAQGIPHEFARTRGETRSCVNAIEASGRQTELLEPGPEVTADELEEFLLRFNRAAVRSSVVVLSGSLPRGVPEGIYGRMTDLAKKAGAKVILDASGEYLTLSISAGPDLVKPNMSEAAAVLGRPLSSQEDAVYAARELIAMGAGAAAVSMGSRGVVYVSRDGLAVRARPPKIAAVNAIGCGDSMVAGFAAAIGAGWEPERQAHFAVALSASSALCEETGAFRVRDLDAVLPWIELRRIT